MTTLRSHDFIEPALKHTQGKEGVSLKTVTHKTVSNPRGTRPEHFKKTYPSNHMDTHNQTDTAARTQSGLN